MKKQKARVKPATPSTGNESERRDAQFHLPSRKQAHILSQLVTGREKYGLEMVENSDGQLKRATVYVILHRMEQDGLISSRLDSDHDDRGPPRRKYRITALGRKALALRQATQKLFGIEEGFVPAT